MLRISRLVLNRRRKIIIPDPLAPRRKVISVILSRYFRVSLPKEQISVVVEMEIFEEGKTSSATLVVLSIFRS